MGQPPHPGVLDSDSYDHLVDITPESTPLTTAQAEQLLTAADHWFPHCM